MNQGANLVQPKNRYLITLLLLMLLAAIGPQMGTTAVSAETVNLEKIEPALQTMLSDQPAAIFPVIVQKGGQETQIEGLVTELGGNLTKALPIINGFAAELSGDMIEQLSMQSSVQYISHDTAVQSSSANTSYNRLKNPGFESGTIGWKLDGYAAINDFAYAGNNALELRGAVFQGVEAIPGYTYNFNLWATRVGDLGDAGMTLSFFNEFGELLLDKQVLISSKSYTQHIVEVEAPETAVRLEVRVWAEGDAGTLLIDDAFLGSDYPGLLQNAGFESGTTGWTIFGTPRVSVDALTGDQALRLGSLFTFDRATQYINATPNENYVLQGWYKRGPNIQWTYAYILFYDQNWNEIADVSVDLLPSGDAYQSFEMAASAPPNTAYLGVRVAKFGSDKVFLDDFNLEIMPEIDGESANMLDNPDFNQGTVYWNGQSTDLALSISSESPFDSTSLKVPAGGEAYQSRLGAAGQLYTLSGWYKTDDTIYSNVIIIRFTDEAGIPRQCRELDTLCRLQLCPYRNC